MKRKLKNYIGTVWKGPEYRSFCHHGVVLYHPPSTWICSPTWMVSKHCCLEYLWKFYYICMIYYITGHWRLSQSLACLLPRGQGKGSECQVSNHCLDFLVTSPQAETVRGPQPPVISLAHKTFITQEIPKMLASMCQEPGTKTTYCDKRLSYNPY